jgi:hypothetical protein
MNERRKNFRVEWHYSHGRIESAGRVMSCTVSNVSNGGAKISGCESINVGDEFALHLFDAEQPRRCRVLWRRDHEFGVQFLDASMRSRPKAATRHQESRRREPAS